MIGCYRISIPAPFSRSQTRWRFGQTHVKGKQAVRPVFDKIKMERDFVVACEVQHFVREHQNKISNASDVAEVIESLSKVVELFMNGSLLPEKVPLGKRAAVREEFTSRYYVRFVESILRPPVADFYKNFNKEQKKLFDVFFLRGPERDSFFVLGSALSQSNSAQVVKIVVPLLEKFTLEGKFSQLFVSECQRPDNNAKDRARISQTTNHLWTQLITLIVSLPERVTNRMRLKSSSVFYPEQFFKTITLQMVHALEELHGMLSMSRDCSLEFLSELIGRVCVIGHGEKAFAILLPAVEKWSETSPLWSRICCRLVTGTSNSALEFVIESILKKAANPNLIAKLLGDSVLTNTRVKYLLTSKFLLLKTYPDVSVLYNIIGYLAGCKRRHLLHETTKALFDVWGNKIAIKHTSYDQHMYITCALLLAVGHMTKEEKQKQKQELLTQLLTGVQGHLESPTEKVRRLGMVVAECVSSALEPDQQKLTFEYEKDEETELLHTLSKGPMFQRKQHRVSPRSDVTGRKDKLEEAKSREAESEASPESDQESDDDLKPYDLGEEESANDSKAPRYLRDCIESLLETENPSKSEASLKVVKKLVCAEPDELQEVCVELVKVLLHLQDRFTTEDFIELRHSAMVAVTIRFPKKIAEYLTGEFFGPNYNLQQRTDMLNVLSDSAQQLSAPKEIVKVSLVPRKFSTPCSEAPTILENIPEWQVFIQERINSKTKRFIQGPSKPPPKAVANQFAAVAGHFFYPLMSKFDGKCSTMDLLGDDSFVLGKLLYTLGIIMFSARGTPSARNMGRALLEFTWALKFHSEPHIRQAVMFTQAMVFLSLPSALLLSDMPSELFDLHDLLRETVQSDASAECRKAALQSVLLLEEIFKSEIKEQ